MYSLYVHPAVFSSSQTLILILRCQEKVFSRLLLYFNLDEALYLSHIIKRLWTSIYSIYSKQASHRLWRKWYTMYFHSSWVIRNTSLQYENVLLCSCGFICAVTSINENPMANLLYNHITSALPPLPTQPSPRFTALSFLPSL